MKKTIFIEGMSCGHCSGRIKSTLKDICGVKEVEVDLTNKKAIVELAHDVEDEKFINSIDELGYKVTSIE